MTASPNQIIIIMIIIKNARTIYHVAERESRQLWMDKLPRIEKPQVRTARSVPPPTRTGKIRARLRKFQNRPFIVTVCVEIVEYDHVVSMQS